MNIRNPIGQYLQRYPALGAVAYLAIMLALVLTNWLYIAGVLDHRASLADANDILGQMERRGPDSHGNASQTATSVPHGSPFVEGRTVTVAGAALLQRVSGAIARVGGRVLSSQVDLQGAQSKQGYLTVIVNCELDPPGLQKLLYDIEAGMPFLFIEQLAVRAPGVSARVGAARMHVLLSASGQWLGKR
jgi:general secretion pathway protein M